MDIVLIEIKNFLRKLESEQIDIEAGQWELFEDISMMKKSLEEILKLKDDVEDMKRVNEQQEDKIRHLEGKLREFKRKYNKRLLRSLEDENNLNPECMESPGEKRSEVLTSTEAIKIISDISESENWLTGDSDEEMSVDRDNPEEDENREEKDTEKENTEKSSDSVIYIRSPTKSGVNTSSSEVVSVTPDQSGNMLQRYLRDSAKYSKRKKTNSTASSMTGDSNNKDEDTATEDTYTEEESHVGDGWDTRKCSRREYKRISLSRSIERTESIIPERMICPKCPRKFFFKTDLTRHNRRHHGSSKSLVCNVCEKVFRAEESLKAHLATHQKYNCGYCSKAYEDEDRLGSHVEMCPENPESRF